MRGTYSIMFLFLLTGVNLTGAQTNISGCDHALIASCDSARRASLFACGTCVGKHVQELEAAGCNATYTEQFCQNQTCIANSSSFLGGMCRQARTNGPFACAKCLGEHAAQLNASLCSVKQQEDYCNFIPHKPPVPDAPLPVTKPSASLHGCHRVSVTSLTINGKDGAQATVPADTQVNFGLTISDSVSNPGACTCPSCITQLLGATYKYESDNQLHNSTGAVKCWVSNNDETESYAGHYTLTFTPTATGIYYLTVLQQMMLSCPSAVFHAARVQTNFSIWDTGSCDGFNNCGGIARIVVE